MPRTLGKSNSPFEERVTEWGLKEDTDRSYIYRNMANFMDKCVGTLGFLILVIAPLSPVLIAGVHTEVWSVISGIWN
jgi:hypothetical protein